MPAKERKEDAEEEARKTENKMKMCNAIPPSGSIGLKPGVGENKKGTLSARNG